jgi:hypothetical protein
MNHLPRYQEFYVRKNPDNLPADELADLFDITAREVLELWRAEEQERKRREYLAENSYTTDLSYYTDEMYSDEPARKMIQGFRADKGRIVRLVDETR